MAKNDQLENLSLLQKKEKSLHGTGESYEMEIK